LNRLTDIATRLEALMTEAGAMKLKKSLGRREWPSEGRPR